MRRHRQAILFAVWLLASFFVLDRSLAFMLGCIVDRSEFRLAKLYHSKIDSQIVVLGNSRGVNGFFAPEMENELGGKVFNLSFNGQDIELLNAVFLDYCDRQSVPKLVVIELTSLQSHDAVVGLKFLLNHSPRIGSILHEANFKDWLLCHLCHVYRYNSEIFLRVLYYLSKSDQDWINSGLVDAEIAKNWKVSDKEIELWNPPSPESLESLSKLVAFARERGIAVRLVIAPYVYGYVDQLENFQNWKAAIQSKLGDDLPIADFSNSIADPSCFADMVHLNVKGSHQFLMQLLDKRFFEVTESEQAIR